MVSYYEVWALGTSLLLRVPKIYCWIWKIMWKIMYHMCDFPVALLYVLVRHGSTYTYNFNRWCFDMA